MIANQESMGRISKMSDPAQVAHFECALENPVRKVTDRTQLSRVRPELNNGASPTDLYGFASKGVCFEKNLSPKGKLRSSLLKRFSARRGRELQVADVSRSRDVGEVFHSVSMVVLPPAKTGRPYSIDNNAC